MPIPLAFDYSYRYAGHVGIDVPTTICVGDRSVEFLARLDTGAASCIFERRFGELVGIDIENGRLQRFRTVAGSFVAYEHEVTLRTLGIEFTAFVFFAESSEFGRNFVGRSGWLDRLRIAIVDYDRELYLSPY